MSKINNISNDTDVLAAIDSMVTALGNQVIVEWDSEKASEIYQEYLTTNLNKYDGKLITASKAYFNEHLNGKVVNTQIGLVRINSKSRGKIHDRMRDVKYLAIPYIPEVLMTGDISDLVPLNKDRDDSAVGYYEFNKSKKLETYTLNITLKVALDTEGNLLYYLGASKEKANLRTVSHARSTTGSKVGFDSIESYDDDEINLYVQVLDKDGNVLSDEEAEKLIFGETPGQETIFKGRSNNVKTAKGTKVSTVFAVLDADQVIASHTATGAENPSYPQELQPRDRSRDSSQAWVQKTSNTLDPESLGRSGRADTGAPIVGGDLVVESGNGRTMAIQLAYERGNADEYKEWLIDEAEYFGFSADQINQFKQPILVRIRTSDVDRVQFTVEANQDDKLSFSATERAKTDAKRLDENLLSLFTPGEDGDLITASNQKFIQGFLKSLGKTEAAQYISTEGKPTQALVTRIKAAIFSKAYNDDRLLEMMADQTKPELQNMLNALGAAAPKFIEAQAVSRGDVQDVSSSIVDGIEQALDKRVTNAIIDAANTILAAKQNDQDIVEFVKQQGLFGDLGEGVPELAVFLSKNSRSAKKMSLLFKAMAEFAEKQAIDGQNMGLFGEPEPVSIKDAINYAVTVIEDNYGENTNLSMFDHAAGFDAVAEGTLSFSVATKSPSLVDDVGQALYQVVRADGVLLCEVVHLQDANTICRLLNADVAFTSIDMQAHNSCLSPFNDLSLPTEEQKQSGEYQKGHLSIGDLNIAIENPAGSIRSGVDANGQEWSSTMQHHYGYIENTLGADGDEIDVFVKNHLDHIPDHAYIIKQLDKDGKFDEQKVIIGAETEEEAKEIYLCNYDKGWQGFGGIQKIAMSELLKKIQHTWSEFDSWASDGHYEHIPLDHVITENAPKIHESKISKEDPIVVLEKRGKYYLIAGMERIALAKKRSEKLIPAIIFDEKDVKTSIIQTAIKKAGSAVDPIALAALIVDELEKSLMHSFDNASNPFLDALYQA